jgi:hypothetical protein
MQLPSMQRGFATLTDNAQDIQPPGIDESRLYGHSPDAHDRTPTKWR